MQANIIYALVAIGAISAGTIGFANTLIVAVDAVNPIGGADTAVLSPGSTITKVSWTEVASTLVFGDIEIGEALVTVDNQSGVTHTYEICVILSDGISIQSVLQCQNTAAIDHTFNEIVSVNFSPTNFDTIAAEKIYITLEELT